MGRSDATFPSYVRLQLNPKFPPEGWDEGIRRCAECKKAWPNLGVFSPSPCCDAYAGISMGEELHPDMTWESAVKQLFEFRFDKYYERWNEGLTDEQLVWLDAKPSYSEVEIEEGINELERLVGLDSSCEM